MQKKTKELKILTGRKRKSLGLPSGRVLITTSGRDFRRELVRMRDKHTCQICRKVWKEGTRAFDVHHKDKDPKKTRQIDKVKEFKNMVTLCHKCHFGLHYGKVINS